MSVRVVVMPTPFHSTRRCVDVEPGLSVNETLVAAGVEEPESYAVTLNGRVAPVGGRSGVCADGDLVTGIARPGEVVTGTAAITAFIEAVGSLTLLEAAISVAATAAAVYGVNKLQRSLAPAAPYDPEEAGSGRRTSIVGEANGLPLYEPLTQILGRHKIRPNYGALPYSSVEGGKLYGYYLFDLGKGPIEFEDLRIGEDPLFLDSTTLVYTGVMNADGKAFDKVELELRKGTPTDDAIRLYSSTLIQTTINRRVRQGTPIIRETPDNVTGFTVIVSFNALIQITNQGKYKQATVRWGFEYKLVTDTVWTSAGNKVMTARTRGSKHFKKDIASGLPPGKYEIRCTRNTANATDPGVLDESTWAAIVSTKDGVPIREPNTARIAMKVKMTNQLPNGVDDLSLIASSIQKDWTGTVWTEQKSSNPASLFRHVLQGPANQSAVTDSEIDLPELESWHDANAALGFEYNSIVGNGGRRTVFQMLQEIAAAGRASFTMVDGKYSVVQENDLSGIPVQMFTPHNSWDFRTEKQITIDPDGLRAGFVDPDNDWIETDRVVPRDGFTEQTAEELSRVPMPGVTDSSQAFKLGRYQLAVMENRDNHYSLNVDWESMNVNRGDWVQVRHDAILVGTGSGRLASVILGGGGEATGVTLDTPVEMDGVSSYGVTIRTTTDVIYRSVVTDTGFVKTLTFTTVIPALDVPSAGDLFAFGLADQTTIDCIVYQIRPGDEYGAQIILIDSAASAILSHETDPVPVYVAEVTDDETTPPDAPLIDSVTPDIESPPPLVEDDPPSTTPPKPPGRRTPSPGLTINGPGSDKGKRRKKRRRKRRRGR